MTRKITNTPEPQDCSKNAADPKPSGYTPEMAAQMSLKSSINSASVIKAYNGNIVGENADVNVMMRGLCNTFAEVRQGDLHTLEAMLIGQATALQTMFSSLARKAQKSSHNESFQAYINAALKAQAQSRATISALVDLKYPRQATFVKQANIAHGPQQVNNGTVPVDPIAHVKEIPPQQNGLLEDAQHGSTYLDIGTAQATRPAGPELEAVGAVHRSKKPRGKGRIIAQCVEGRTTDPASPVHQGNEPGHTGAKKDASVTAAKTPQSEDDAFEAEIKRQMDRQDIAFEARNEAMRKTKKYIPPSAIEQEVDAWLAKNV